MNEHQHAHDLPPSTWDFELRAIPENTLFLEIPPGDCELILCGLPKDRRLEIRRDQQTGNFHIKSTPDPGPRTLTLIEYP